MLPAFQGPSSNNKELAMRATTRRIALFFCLTLCLGILSNIARAQAYSVLYDVGFTTAGVTLDQQGRLYGTTIAGDNGKGEVYRLTRVNGSWIFSRLYSFDQDHDGSSVYAGVVFGPDGALYGMTMEGGAYGYGTVYRLQPPAAVCHAVTCPWLETILYNFTGGADGAYPSYGNLAFDQSGNIYGTTYSSGNGEGVIFKLTRSGSSWTESVLWNGANFFAGVLFDLAGNLYAGTQDSVIELSPTQSGWNVTTLYTGNVGGGLVWGHGDLFGLTGDGPQGGDANVWELASQNGSWNYTELQDLGEQYFGPAAPPTFDAQGNLYGPLPSTTTNTGGEIFKLTPSGNQWIYSAYHIFTGGSGGSTPVGAVTFDASGNMYGTTLGQDGDAVVWEITP
jgi:uncharacterized repeat protein (TIGR03803 family)